MSATVPTERTAAKAELAEESARIQAARQAAARPVRQVRCPVCDAGRGAPCTPPGPAGNHLGRLIAAVRLGLLSRAELAGSVGGLEVIADHVVILERAA